MAELDEQVRTIKARIEQARQAQARAEHERDVAAAAQDQAARQLLDEFGVHSLEEARTLLAQLENQAAAECRKVDEALAVAEGS